MKIESQGSAHKEWATMPESEPKTKETKESKDTKDPKDPKDKVWFVAFCLLVRRENTG